MYGGLVALSEDSSTIIIAQDEMAVETDFEPLLRQLGLADVLLDPSQWEYAEAGGLSIWWINA